MDKPIVIFGAKGLAFTVLDSCHASGRIVYCLLDEDEALHGQELGDISIMGGFDHQEILNILGEKCGAFVALASREAHESCTQQLIKAHKTMPVNVIHPKASVSAHAIMGHGNLIAANVCLEGSANVGSHCQLMPNVTIHYDVKIGDYAQLGASATIGAGAQIGQGAVLGQNVSVAPGVQIGANAQVGHGSVVLSDIEAGKIAFGVPAKAL